MNDTMIKSSFEFVKDCLQGAARGCIVGVRRSVYRVGFRQVVNIHKILGYPKAEPCTTPRATWIHCKEEALRSNDQRLALFIAPLDRILSVLLMVKPFVCTSALNKGDEIEGITQSNNYRIPRTEH